MKKILILIVLNLIISPTVYAQFVGEIDYNNIDFSKDDPLEGYQLIQRQYKQYPELVKKVEKEYIYSDNDFMDYQFKYTEESYPDSTNEEFKKGIYDLVLSGCNTDSNNVYDCECAAKVASDILRMSDWEKHNELNEQCKNNPKCDKWYEQETVRREHKFYTLINQGFFDEAIRYRLDAKKYENPYERTTGSQIDVTYRFPEVRKKQNEYCIDIDKFEEQVKILSIYKKNKGKSKK